LYPTDSSCYSSFRSNFEMPNIGCVFHVSTSTKLDTFSKTDCSYIISVFLPEKCHSSFFNSLLKRNRTLFNKRQLLLNSLVYKVFYFFQLFIGYFSKVRKVETK